VDVGDHGEVSQPLMSEDNDGPLVASECSGAAIQPRLQRRSAEVCLQPGSSDMIEILVPYTHHRPCLIVQASMMACMSSARSSTHSSAADLWAAITVPAKAEIVFKAIRRCDKELGRELMKVTQTMSGVGQGAARKGAQRWGAAATVMRPLGSRTGRTTSTNSQFLPGPADEQVSVCLFAACLEPR
jgi:hypothetical protein